MNPIRQNLIGTTSGTGSHAHLLVTETGGLVLLETPAAVIEEVNFRATHVGSLLEELFEESKKHDCILELDAG